MTDDYSSILDDYTSLTSRDPHQLITSVDVLANQFEDAFAAASLIQIPETYNHCQALVMTGMGGSGLGARFIDSVFGEILPLPLAIIHDYHLPHWVNESTLVLLSSYSGDTEEIIQNFHDAISKKAKILVISSGGELTELAKKFKVPYYLIDPKYNPCHQPRMALGYSIFGQLTLVSKLGLISLNENQVLQVSRGVTNIKELYNAKVPLTQNLAKNLACLSIDKNIILFTGKHLQGSAHIIKNQLNENAKHFADIFEIPEANHHLLEGFKYPNKNPDTLQVIMIDSDLYSDKIKRRVDITVDIITQHGINVQRWKPMSSNYLTQAFELLQFGSYFVYYLSALHQLNPTPIPWVDYFKLQLNSSSKV